MKFSVETYGLNALERTFNNLRDFRDKRNIMLSAFRKALKPTVDIAYANAPQGKTGNLKRSIGLVAVRNEIAMYAGARIKGGYKGYIGHIIEEGTVERFYMSKNGVRHNTGRLRYSGFFKRAADSTERQAINIVADEWHKAIGRFIVRNDRKDN